MLKKLNIKEEDVIAFIEGKKSPLHTVVTQINLAASEGVALDKAIFCEEDAKIVRNTMVTYQDRLEMLEAMTPASEDGLGWISELFTENKTEWINTFTKRINDAKNVGAMVTIINDIDKKIQDCKDTLEDKSTFRKFLRRALKVGTVAGVTMVAGGIAGIAALAAALGSSVYIAKGKSLLRQVMTELMTIRRKAIEKREKLRKEAFTEKPKDAGSSSDNHEDDSGNDTGDDEDFGAESTKVIDSILDA